MNKEEYIKVKCSRPDKTENMRIVSQPNSEKLISKCTDYDIPEKMKQLYLTLKKAAGKTTYMEDFCWNHNKNEGSNKTSSRNVQYIKSGDDEQRILLYGMDNRPPNPSQIPSSEFKSKYLNISDQKFISKNTDLSSKVHCKIRNPCKDQQPVMKTVSKGFSKHLDPYISTTHFDFYEIPLKELEKFKSKQLQYGLRKRITPLYDESFFRLKYHEKVLPKITNPVPHTGMESEMKSSYRLNFDEVKLQNYKNVGLPTMVRETKAEIMLTPSVYQTEYNRLGINHNLSPPIR